MKSDAIVGTLKAAASAGVDVDDALDQLSDLVELAHSKPVKTDLSAVEVILTEVPLGFQGMICVVGWDTCGGCARTVRNCQCKNGPTEPAYVKKFRSEPSVQSASTLPTPVTKVDGESGLSASSRNPSPATDDSVCRDCQISKPAAEIERNDDGSVTCFDCQQ